MIKYIIDAHAHLWLKQDAVVEGKRIQSLTGGKSEFMGEVRQMMPPYMLDGKNTAEMFLSNMDYARVSAAVITQEYIDGNQDDYLISVQQKYPDRFLCCAYLDARKPGFYNKITQAAKKGFNAVKLPAGRLITTDMHIRLTSDELMQVFAYMQKDNMILSVDLADGDLQVSEMNEIIAEFPDLRIAIGHFGMVNRPGWKEQIKLCENKNVRVESGGITWLFHEEFYPYKGAVRAIKESIDLVGVDKLMWGSDYPRTMTAITYTMSYDFVLKSSELSETEKVKFLGENAIDFYQFKNLPELSYIKNMVE